MIKLIRYHAICFHGNKLILATVRMFTVWSRAIKEESKVTNRDWVDYQACSLLQYINAIANLFIMRNYFNKLH